MHSINSGIYCHSDFLSKSTFLTVLLYCSPIPFVIIPPILFSLKTDINEGALGMPFHKMGVTTQNAHVWELSTLPTSTLIPSNLYAQITETDMVEHNRRSSPAAVTVQGQEEVSEE